MVQNSSSSQDSPQGNITSYLLANARGHLCKKSFSEHGIFMVIGAIRVANRTYAQGLPRCFKHLSRFDFMFPEFVHVGDQEIRNSEIYLSNVDATNKAVFGYQTRYSEYKYDPDCCSGLMRPQVENTLGDLFTYAENFNSVPMLSQEFLQEDKSNLERTLAITSELSGSQFVVEVQFSGNIVRCDMSGVPGLIDHRGLMVL